MNTIREGFRREVEALVPVLHEAYQRVGRYQKSRTGRNEALLRGALAEVGAALAFFKGLVPRKKRPYFDAILEECLSLSDRVIALDVAVGAMHIEFSVPRAYMHRESEELRRALELTRVVESDRQERLHGVAPDVLLSGIAASPGYASGKAAIIKRSSAYRRLPSGSIVVARMTRTDMMIGVTRITAIVTDLGGSLCHAAIVAREIGIPCVVGTERATELITAKQLIAVDGTMGVVRAASPGGRNASGSRATKGAAMIHIRWMGPDEAERIRELDVSEEGDIVYKWVDGEVVAVPEQWTRPRWSDEECSRRISSICHDLTEGGVVMIGAFDGDLLVGVATFRAYLSPGMSELAGLWVSCTHRRQGVATRLVQEVEGLAHETGSSGLYVSATPSRSAVGFYRSRGFRPTLDVNKELYEREPEDIHMVLDLAGTRRDAAED